MACRICLITLDYLENTLYEYLFVDVLDQVGVTLILYIPV